MSAFYRRYATTPVLLLEQRARGPPRIDGASGRSPAQRDDPNHKGDQTYKKGARIMNYGKYVRMDKNRLRGLERIEDRMRHAMISTSTPFLEVDEISILLNGSYLKKPQAKRDPKQIVVDWCETERDRIIEEWKFDRFHFENETLEALPSTSLHDSLIIKVQGWTMIEALKVIKIFEEIDALSLTALRLTPEGIHRLLQDTRTEPA